MNSFDRKLAKIFKGTLKKSKDGLGVEKLSSELGKIMEQVVNEDLRKTLEECFSRISHPTQNPNDLDCDHVLGLLRVLVGQGFRELPAVLFISWFESLKNLSFDQILPIAPTTVCLGKWAKVAKVTSQEIEAQLFDRLDRTYSTIGANWILERPKSEMVAHIVGKFLTRQSRPKYLPAWDESLVQAIKKDKRGELLAAILRHSSIGCDHILVLSEAVRSNRNVFKMVSDLLPVILIRKDSGPNTVSFVKSLFDVVFTTCGNEREFVTAMLARLGAGILLADRRTSISGEALTLIHRMNRQLRNLTNDESMQVLTWVLENLSQENSHLGGKSYINIQGARYVALAFEKAEQGFPAKEILAVTARNLGLSPVGKKDEAVSYDPILHEDLDGGLVPGEAVVILEPGWSFNHEAVIRAKVKKGAAYV